MANLGLTALALLPAIYGLMTPFQPGISESVLTLLLGAFAYDCLVFYTTSLKGQ